MKIKYDEFDIDNEGKRNKKITYIVVGVILLLFIILVVFLIFNNKSNSNDNVNNIVDNNQYFISLTGETSISIYQGDTYVELGYQGYDKYNNDLTDNVIVNNSIDTSKIGTYTISYELNGTVVTRTVNVVEKPIGATYIYLYNLEEIVYLNIGDTYKDPGYIVVDTVDNNLTDKVKVENNIDTSKPGSYEIIYSVVNSSGVTTTAVRRIEVLGGTITLKLSNNKSTPDPVYINVVVTDNNFSYLILPDGNKVTNKETSYKVTTNGTYKFVSYDKFGNKTEQSITVSNIIEVNVPAVTVHTSDNITSGNKHSIGFLLKLTSDASTIYYCLDSNNTCEPNTKYTEQLRFASSQQKYLRYKSCDKDGYCNKVQSYKVNLSISLVNPDVSTSTKSRYGTANPYQAAYYYQADSRWSSFKLYGSHTMAASGCGYNAYAMILTGITHDYSITPSKLVEILREYRTKYGVQFQATNESGVLYNAIIHNHTYMKKDYGYDSAKLWRYDEDKITIKEKKVEIVESLKMGHMIFANVPGHYVAFVGINENDEIYVFDSSKGSSLQNVDKLYDETYYNYRNKCTTNGNCGIRIAYEIYPAGGMSLDDWNKIK